MDQVAFGISVFLLLLEDITSELWGAIYGALLFWVFFYFSPDVIWFHDDFPMKVFVFWKEIVKEKKKTSVNFCSHKLTVSMISKLE